MTRPERSLLGKVEAEPFPWRPGEIVLGPPRVARQPSDALVRDPR